MVEWFWLANVLTTVVIGIMGWLMKTGYTRLTSVESKLQDTRERYVHKDDMKELKSEINRRFDEIKELLLYKPKD